MYIMATGLGAILLLLVVGVYEIIKSKRMKSPKNIDYFKVRKSILGAREIQKKDAYSGKDYLLESAIAEAETRNKKGTLSVKDILLMKIDNYELTTREATKLFNAIKEGK